jgi:hypothetical protein
MLKKHVFALSQEEFAERELALAFLCRRAQSAGQADSISSSCRHKFSSLSHFPGFASYHW